MRVRTALATAALLALASSPRASIVAGHDYEALATPQPQATNGKIEVVEFFSWGCPHCYEFYPKLARWLGTLPKDSTFTRIPVGLGHPEWEALAKAFYALQVTGDVDRLDSAIFEDIHRNHVSLHDESSITAWVARHGVDLAKFTAAYQSFGVDMSSRTADQKSIAYQLSGVPTLAIAGKYTVTGDHAAMLNTADQLITMARATGQKTR